MAGRWFVFELVKPWHGRQVFVFEFVNSFLAMFYTAFVASRAAGTLPETLQRLTGRDPLNRCFLAQVQYYIYIYYIICICIIII